jgi:hypothetical protein
MAGKQGELFSRQCDLVFDDFAHRLSKEIALIIAPTYGLPEDFEFRLAKAMLPILEASVPGQIFTSDEFVPKIAGEIHALLGARNNLFFSYDGVVQRASRLAMLVSRRAREERRIPDFFGNTQYCPNCGCRNCQLENKGG